MGKGGRVRVKQVGGGGGAKMPMNPLADLMGGILPEDEMIQLPPNRDSNSGFMIWPMNETFTMQFKTFSAIYPNYLDSDKTVKLGRRIAAKDAVPEPTIQDIHEALALLDIRHVIQPHKGYSRDASSRWDNPGRIMVDLEGAIQNGIFDKSPDGAYDLDTLPDMGDDDDNNGNQNTENGEGRRKKQFLRRLALVISGLPNRQKRIEVKSKLLEEEKIKAAKEEEKVVVKPGVITNGTSGNRKKKGKKKK